MHLTKNSSETVSQNEYARVIRSLMYLTNCTKPDLAHVINVLSRYTSNPGHTHWKAITRVLNYLHYTKDFGLHYGKGPAVRDVNRELGPRDRPVKDWGGAGLGRRFGIPQNGGPRGLVLCGIGLKVGWPKRTAGNPNVPHRPASSFHRVPEKTKERESERKTSRRQKKLSSGDREAPVIPSRLLVYAQNDIACYGVDLMYVLIAHRLFRLLPDASLLKKKRYNTKLKDL
ncbi:hypothetical protein YC2023_081598 [Brassica napus]